MVFLYSVERDDIEEVDPSDAIKKMYYQEYRLPTSEEIEKSRVPVKEYYKSHSLNEVKKIISRNENYVPLFNVYHNNLYLIRGEKVFLRVMHDSYRFPDENITNLVKDKREKILQDPHYKMKYLSVRRLRKFNLMLDFLNQLDIDVLYDSFQKAFIKYSLYVNLAITCPRPSFISHYKHLTPYYSRVELIKLAKNMNIEFDEYIDLQTDRFAKQTSLNKICQVVSKNDIKASILKKHQIHIVETNKVGLFKYYTLQGSALINTYLRNLPEARVTNRILEEEIIRPIWETVLSAPEFDKDYYVYRFVKDDKFVSHLKVGDIFEDLGFMSTTRDPFYRSEDYQFGFILFKIKIPGGKKGVALSLELMSQFAAEQEIILAPKTKLKLISRDYNVPYFHVDIDFATTVKTRYEFEFVSTEPVNFIRSEIYKTVGIKEIVNEKNVVDFLKLEHKKYSTLQERIRTFNDTVVRRRGGFYALIGGKEFYVFVETFDGTGVYKDFYAIKTENGYGMYCIDRGYTLFYIEIGTSSGNNEIQVNYSLRYTSIDRSSTIDDESFFTFISSISYYFRVPKALIHMEYRSCDIDGKAITEIADEEKSLYNSSYPLDVYIYLKKGRKRYENMLEYELTPKFSHSMLDELEERYPLEVLDKEDRDELYQLYLRNYDITKTKNTIADFYIWLVENFCFFNQTLISKMHRIFNRNDNPFSQLAYVLDAYSFLYNRKKIFSISDENFSEYNIVDLGAPSTVSEYRRQLKLFKHYGIL